jgi:hypothetical protein
MKIDWKTFSFAIVASIIVTAIFGIILSTILYPEIPWEKIFNQLKNNHTSITFAEGTGFSLNVHFIPLWILIIVHLLVVAVLTIVFYFLIQYRNKQKEKNV